MIAIQNRTAERTPAVQVGHESLLTLGTLVWERKQSARTGLTQCVELRDERYALKQFSGSLLDQWDYRSVHTMVKDSEGTLRHTHRITFPSELPNWLEHCSQGVFLPGHESVVLSRAATRRSNEGSHYCSLALGVSMSLIAKTGYETVVATINTDDPRLLNTLRRLGFEFVPKRRLVYAKDRISGTSARPAVLFNFGYWSWQWILSARIDRKRIKAFLAEERDFCHERGIELAVDRSFAEAVRFHRRPPWSYKIRFTGDQELAPVA